MRNLAIVVAVTVFVVTGALGIFTLALGPAPLGKDIALSATVLDRDGRLLRAYTTPDGRWRLPATRESVDPRFLAILFGYEDKRFLAHRGIDPLAAGRAAQQLLTSGRIVSGASTLTMQVARLLEPRTERSWTAKLRQAIRALQLEYALTKDDILALYLTLAPYGGNLEGVRSASLAYFGKEPRRLTLGEAALLVALPQSPETRRPDRHADVARRARDRVLDRVAAAGIIPADEAARAKTEAVPDDRRPMPLFAPHSADNAISLMPDERIHRLTIDFALQRSLEDLARERARTLGPDISVAILAIDHATGEVLARVASSDYFDLRRAGQVDMTRARRSPGSTLKPFIYGFGFEDGVIHPETLIEDRPIRFGGYAPENFDLTFQGTVSIRKALQLSLNVPAVAVLDTVGASRFTARLTQAGAAMTFPKGEVPGLAMGLGGVGVTLDDLVMLYGGVARGGDTIALTEHRRPTASLAGQPAKFGPEHRLMEPLPAWYLGQILLGTPPPDNAAGGRIAFKTGTSYGYRDAWAVGFEGKIAIGVWVGRPDGAPVPGLVGRAAAAPILFDAFGRSGRTLASLPKAPKGALLAANAKLPPPLKHFRGEGYQRDAGPPLRIMYPPDGAQIDLAVANEPVPLKVAGGARPLTMLVNGVPQAAESGRTLFYTPDGPGFVRLTVMDAAGRTDSVLVRLQ